VNGIIWIAKEASLKPDWTQSLRAGGFVMAFKAAIGDKVDQAFSLN
jgi:hypothetical protein